MGDMSKEGGHLAAELHHAVDDRRAQVLDQERCVALAFPRELGRRVAEAGEVMPQKSTFFYPKLATGLFINPLS